MGKIYLYFVKEDNEFAGDKRLYAFTENKEYDKRFQEERDMENFIRKVRRTDDFPSEEDWRLFRADNKELMLMDIPLEDKSGEYISLLGTGREEANFNKSVDLITDDLQDLIDEFERYKNEGLITSDFYEKISNFLQYYKENSILDADLDTFHLYLYLYRNTFQSPKVWKTIYSDEPEYVLY